METTVGPFWFLTVGAVLFFSASLLSCSEQDSSVDEPKSDLDRSVSKSEEPSISSGHTIRNDTGSASDRSEQPSGKNAQQNQGTGERTKPDRTGRTDQEGVLSSSGETSDSSSTSKSTSPTPSSGTTGQEQETKTSDRSSSGNTENQEDKDERSGKRALKKSWHTSITERPGTIVPAPYRPDGPSLDVPNTPIKIYRRSSTFIIPGSVINRTAVLELFLCSKGGKTHESVLVTEVTPKKFNTSMFLTNFNHEKNPSEIGPQYLGDPTVPEGDPVVVLVEWELNNGEWIRYRAEDLVHNVREDMTMRRFGYVFAGSQFIKNVGPNREKKEIFEASRVKTIMALLHDPSAILDIPVPQGGTDTAFRPRKNVLPPNTTPVNIIVRPPNSEEQDEIKANIEESKKVWGPKKEELKGKEGREGNPKSN